ncbi:FAD-dependent oxidoreductase [Enteractinococcus coprophilus]|uniref:Isorenieratene synthase n=1 Tax=Enteractinococcus coprophilus TaxID=1027633 RepID=A0A543APC2_9MICC|nr:FAD-dependent oxidoreductase [Enteractinococcus coprophilus]TQL74418.1 isorenieratene synthase [Enteractinococcus coprophilus]
MSRFRNHAAPNAPRDPHAERIPAHRGHDRVESARSVAVIGGGIAGLAAATALAERGVEVTLYESAPQLGGRVRSWPLDDGRNMSRGFHAFFRQYYNLRALLRRTDPALDRLQPVADYPLQTDTGLTDSFEHIPRTPPLNLAAFVLGSPTFPITGLAEVNLPSAFELIDLQFPESLSRYDGESAAAFLDRLRFPDGARHLALEVFARSFFADPHDFAARELVTMFHTYFTGSAEGLLFDVPVDDFNTSLWDPLGDYLHERGATIHLGTQVDALQQTAPGWRVTTTASETSYDAVVLAADPRASRKLIAGLDGDTPQLVDLQARAARRRNAPAFAVIRLWMSETVRADRPAFLGTSGYQLLDNISVLERFEATAAGWTQTYGGSVLELHAYAVDDPADPDSARGQAIRAALLADMVQVFPETQGMEIVAEEYLLEDDCGLADVSPWQDHPAVDTGVPGLKLAGDWIRAPLPVALMERAATTGFLAANELLEGWHVTGHDLHSPPRRGLLRRSTLGRAIRNVALPKGAR